MPQRVLLTSVFKPFAVDNIYSRVESKIELFHNQVTKAQGLFSLRNFHHTYGLHAIANNIDVPTTVLDYPTLERFRREVKKGYDIVGIGSILPNFQKVKRLVEETRELSPKSKIVIGGFCATLPNLEKLMDVDYVCVGEGISFMRDLLGLEPEFKFKNPDVYSDHREIFGAPIYGKKSPQIIVGLGCSYGCDFCAPSHFFGRKHIKFFKTGSELFKEMLRMEKLYRSNEIGFAGDDNFLLDLGRAEELRQCVAESGRIFKLFVFGSADRAMKFGPEKLAEMGVNTIWIGRESRFRDFGKNKGLNMAEVIAELRRYGIKTIMSSILLIEEHTKRNIREDIDDHLACNPTFSQFAFYSPVHGTELFDRLYEENRILTAVPFEEWHAFKQPWFIHPEFNLMEAEKIQNEAYDRDFLELGPSVMRFVQADYEGWLNLKDSPKPHLRARAKSFADSMWRSKIILRATEHLAPNEKVRELARDLRGRIEKDFGPITAFERTAARGLHATGRFREFRTKHWGDAIQPRTKIIHYNYQ